MLTIQELYEYSSSVRRKFAEKLAQMDWESVSKNREASFYSMKNILLHMIDNEDWIVNWVVRERAKEYVRMKSDDYLSMQMIMDHLEEVEKKTKSYLGSLSDDDQKRKVKLVLRSSGAEFDLSVEECLLQSFTEQLFHLGELIALLWQENIEPPTMQWFYNNPRALKESS